METKDKILKVLLIITIFASTFINYKAYAEGEVTYKVEEVTNATDINSKNLYQYILVYEDENAGKIAFAATPSTNGRPMISRDNYCSVSVENGILTVLNNQYPNIVWNLTKSPASVLEDGDHPVLQSAANIFPDTNTNQIKLASAGTGGNGVGGYAGISFSDNGNGFSFEKTSNNKFKIYENNCSEPENYLSYANINNKYCFCKGTEANAVEFSVYKIIKNYNYSSSKFITDEEAANMEKVTVSKQVSEYENYSDTAIAEVKLTTNGTNYEKTYDILLILDDSTSVYDSAPGDASKTRAQIIREEAYMFAQKLLEKNSNNRISVIKFGSNITNEADVDNYGFSSNISEIETMIGGDKATVSYGTDYSIAFRKANEVMEHSSDPSHGKAVILISDGMPSIYNGIHYEVFQNTEDSTGIANNWINYLTNTPLIEAELMKQTGTTIFAIGSLEEDTSVDNSTGYIIPSGTSRNLLTNIANGSANFYDFDTIDTELERILEDISKSFNCYPTNATVTDRFTRDIELLTKDVTGYIPEIVFKIGDTIVERITFNSDGTQAFSSLKPNVNILNGKKFTGENIIFDGDTMTWKIGDLSRQTYSLEFPIYLNNTVNTYGEGSTRPSGDYSVSDTTQLSYTDVTNSEVTKEFNNVDLKWVSSTNKPTKNKSNESETLASNGESAQVTVASPENKPNQEQKKRSNELSTGDNTVIIAINVILIVVILNFGQIQFAKNRRGLTRLEHSYMKNRNSKTKKARIEKRLY